MAKKINITLFDNMNYDFDEYKKTYQEEQELSDKEMQDISDDTIYDFIYNRVDCDWDDFKMNLKNCKWVDVPCVIIGSLGLWNGRENIIPTYCEDLETAIKKCVGRNDYVTIKQVGGHIEVCGAHHDGLNFFAIYLLNDKGINATKRISYGIGCANIANRRYHKAISGYLF